MIMKEVVSIQYVKAASSKVLLLLAAVLMVSCSSDDPEPEPVIPVERTILVYMAAENNLASSSYQFDVQDLQEMREASRHLDDRYRLIVYYDGLGSNPPYIGRLRNGEMVDSTSMEKALAADPAVLERVLRYTRTTYPAPSYGLVLWGHATGWLITDEVAPSAQRRAYGGVTGTGQASTSDAGSYWMNVPDMAKAIANAMGQDSLLFILADCCNFCSVETAYELRSVTDYLIASPAEIPGYGAPYDLIIPDLFSSSSDFYRKAVDHYYDYYYDYYKAHPEYDLSGYSVPLTVVRSAALEPLAKATSTLLATIPGVLAPEGSLDLSDMTYYGFTNKYHYNGTRFNYDMYQTLRQYTDPDDFAQWVPYHQEAVPYSRYSSRWETIFGTLLMDMYHFPKDASQCGLLPMYFPHEQYMGTNPNLNKTIHQYQWASAVRWSDYGWPAE